MHSLCCILACHNVIMLTGFVIGQALRMINSRFMASADGINYETDFKHWKILTHEHMHCAINYDLSNPDRKERGFCGSRLSLKGALIAIFLAE